MPPSPSTPRRLRLLSRPFILPSPRLRLRSSHTSSIRNGGGACIGNVSYTYAYTANRHPDEYLYTNSSKCPHGAPSAYVFVIGVLTAVMSFNAAYGCFFVVATNPFDRFPDFDGEIGLGLWTREDIFEGGYRCIMYSDDYIDNSLDGVYAGARLFGFASVVAFTIVPLCLIVLVCYSYHPDYFYYIGAVSMAGSLFQILTFLIFLSSVCEDDQCSFSIGAGIAAAATAVGFLNAVLLFNMPPVYPPDWNASHIAEGDAADSQQKDEERT